MFKSKKKRLQQKQQAEAAAAAAAIAKVEAETIILPQLNKDIDPNKLVRQQEHLASLRDIPETLSPPLSPPPSTTFRSSSNSSLHDNDGSKQYQDLAAWRHLRSQNRYSNGLFGGKQRGRPKLSASKRGTDITDEEEAIDENPETDITTAPAPQKDNEEEAAPAIQSTRDALAMDEDEEDEEEEDEFLDDRQELEQEEYEPESDTEENFFFQDFSGNSKPKKRTTTTNLNGRRRRSQKVMSRFDLSSFARDLHDHRLSVIQPRESRIIMTEDDELELEKLLERQRQRMSVMTMSGSTDSLKVIPPLPSLDLIKPHTTAVLPSPSSPTPPPASAAAAQSVIKRKETAEELEIEKMPNMNSDHGSSTTNSFSSTNGSTSPANSSRGSYPSHIEHDDEDSNKIAVESEKEDNDEDIITAATTTTDVSQEIVTTPKTPIPVSSRPVASISSSSMRHQQHPFKIDPLKRSVSTTSIKSNKSTQFRPAPTPLARIRDENEPAESRLQKQQARKSMSMDDMQSKLDINESSVTSSALDWINEDSRPSSRIREFLPIQNQADAPTLYQEAKPNKSRGLFGSLRQVSRSKTHHHAGNAGGLKGLVRNFSTSHQTKSNSQLDTHANASDTTTTGMSRAAMAVIQHNVAKHEQKKASPVIPDETQDGAFTSPPAPSQQKTRQRAKSDANNNNSSGSRLIAQLLSRASSANKSRRSNSTKIVNMEQEDAAAKKRAQVVRKTIIYVQPDSLHNLLKNGGDGSSIKVPPVPRPPKPQDIDVEARNTFMSDGSLSPDDDTIRSKEYFTATKVSRQTSVRKRVVEAQEDTNASSSSSSSPLKESTSASGHDHTSAGGMLSRNGSKRRWQLQSMDEDDMLSTHPQKADNYMEGVELREMSDGSVVWGVVKKQGNRKSFYAPNKQNQLELVEDGEDNDDNDQEEQDVHGEEYFRNKVIKNSYSSNATLQTQHATTPLPPPPIPRRSPRRQQIPVDPAVQTTKTDIFYSDQVTLPSLLRMMQEQQDQHEYPGDISEEEDEQQQYIFNERAMSSVDDQLDEMMRILTAK
ncbi:hypothetical protein PS15m_008570 [Mucor circinelloides]